jgi:DnaK suppressor protein
MPKAQKATVKAKTAAPVKKSATPARTTAAKSTRAKPTTVRSSPVRATPAKSVAKATKATPAKGVAKTAKAAPPKATAKTTKAAPAKSAVTAKTVTAKKVAPAVKTAPARRNPQLEKFLVEQRELLGAERADYLEKAAELKAEADSLALEHEPGDIQFDEEGGEGGTTNVDRELDLALSAQARAAVDEIDRALAKITAGTYGLCERCGKEIPRPRLKALPYAALCVQCKSGGLSHR